MRSGERGFTYLWLLLALALGGAALAALGEQWAVAAQREREAELLFRGREMARALESWRAATPAGQLTAPAALQELLVDTRGPVPQHHLRRLYTDPFARDASWDLLRDDKGRIVAVASRSHQLALARPPIGLRPGANPARPQVGDWLFEAATEAPAVPPAAAPTSPAQRTPKP